MSSFRALAVVVLLAIVSVHAGSKLQAISGGFYGVDSLRADGLTVWSHDHNMFLPHSQGANAQAAFVSQFGTTASVGADGSLYWLGDDGTDFSQTLSFVANATGRISSRGVRLFGEATIFTVGQDTSPATDRVYNGNYIKSLRSVGSGANQRLVVCLAPGAVSSPFYLRSGSSNRVQGPDPLAPMLVEYPFSSFVTGRSLVESKTAPNVLTPESTYGVDCSSLHAAGDNIYVLGNNPPAFWQRAGSSWTMITGRGPSNTSNIFGGGKGPSNTPNSQLRFGYDTSGVPVPHIYSLDPNQNPVANDTRKRIWRLSGTTWSSVMGTDAMDNLTLVDYAVGTNNDVYLLFSGFSSYAVDKFPVGEYVFKAVPNGQWTPVAQAWHLRDSKNNHLSPGTIRLHWDTSNTAAQTLIIYGDLGQAVSSGAKGIIASDPDKLIADDFNFFSRSFNHIAKLSTAGDEWLPAYGGGFAAVPTHIVSFFGSKRTYFIGTTDFVFQRYSGPVAVYRDDVGRWSDLYETASSAPSGIGAPLDSGDFETIMPAHAVVADLDFVRLGSEDVAIVGGLFRTGLKGTVQLHSIAVIPMGSNGAAKPNAVCGLRHNSLTGVRDSTNGVPQNYLFMPGTVTALEYVSESRQLFVIGAFDSAGDSPASNIAVFQFGENPSCNGGYYDGVWSEVAGGIHGSPITMERIGDYLYVGGDFDRVGVNQFANNIAAYNLKTKNWEMMNAGLDGEVRRIQKFNGLIYVGGKFASGSGIDLPHVAIWEKGRWHRPWIQKLRSQCGKGCSFVCASAVETCTPDWDYVVDMRQVSTEEIVFYGVKNGGSTGVLYSLNVVDQTGYWLLNSAGFSGVQDEDNALPLGKGLNSDELYVWNLESPDNTYPVNYVSVFNYRQRNAIYRQGTGVDGIVYSTWPDYDGKSYKKSHTLRTVLIVIGVVVGVILLAAVLFAVWKFVLSGSSAPSGTNGNYVLQQN